MVSGTKLSAFPASANNMGAGDTFIGPSDVQWSLKQAWGGFATQGMAFATPYQFGGSPSATDNSQAFTDMFASGAAACYIPPGTWKIATLDGFGVLIPATCTLLFGAGASSVIQYTGANTFAGPIYINGLIGAPVTGFEMFGLTFNTPRASNQAWSFGIFSDSALVENVNIHDNNFAHSGRMAITSDMSFSGSTNIRIDNNYFADFDASAVQLTGCAGDLYFNNNRVIGDGAALIHQVWIISGGGKVLCNNNYIYKHSAAGFGIAVHNATTGTQINGNQIIDGKADCLEIIAFDSNVSGFEICNNIIDGPTVTAVDLGIAVISDNGHTISNGTVKGNFIRKRWFEAVGVGTVNAAGTVTNIEVAQNYIMDCNQANDAGNAAVELFGNNTLASTVGTSTAPNIVRDNTILSSDGKTKYGVNETQGLGTVNYTYVFNNMIIGAATGRTNLTGANSQQTGNAFP